MSIKRSAGILLPISSLPSNYGIGSLGEEAYNFIDFLKQAKQSYWQILPIGPTSQGDSPYASFSSYAGNPYFVDLDMLIKDKLLTVDDVKDLTVDNPQYVDYGNIYNTRFEVLRKAYKRGIKKSREAFDKFVDDNSGWVVDYSLFMALKKHFDNKSWDKWDDESIRLRKANAVEKYLELLKDDVEFYQFIQFLFFNQYSNLKEYAHKKGIKIIGDLPIYVAFDSADTWSHPEAFQLTSVNIPKEVAGVPPDYFSEDGQLWGNPLYDWQAMQQNGFKWWIERIDGASRYYDVLRIDHFRGFESYWAVPYGAETAKKGRWVKGPGMSFVGTMIGWFHNVEFIAEDLGILTDEVEQLLEDSGLPGMRVMEFGMEANNPGKNTPLNYVKNCIAYIGTHDNTTALGWAKNASRKDLNYVKKYFGTVKGETISWTLLRGGMSSVANLFVGQMQDYLDLGDEARINTPGTVGNNWKWRLLKGQANRELAKRIAELTVCFGR